VEGSVVVMRDEDGKATGSRQVLSDGDDPHFVAGRMKRSTWLSKDEGSDFNRPLNFPNLAVV
jgi:hypothetical protein